MQIKNSQINVGYVDFVTLIEAFGFIRVRGEGSHSVYKRGGVPKIMCIQNDKGKAKPYQIRQFFAIIQEFELKLEDDNG